MTNMNRKHVDINSAHNHKLRIRTQKWIAFAAIVFAQSALAENILEDIKVRPGTSGQTDIVLQLSQDPTDPKAFATDNPPRIAIDLADTRNALTERRKAINGGALSAISTVEAAGRTRVVLEMARSVPYTTRVEGKNIIVSVKSGMTAAATTLNSSGGASLVSNEVTNVDFRRGPNGEGRILVKFTGSNASSDMHESNGKLVIDLGNARLPENLARQYDVTDFATPVQMIDVRPRSGGTRIELMAKSPYDKMSYQAGNEFVLEISPPKINTEKKRDSRLDPPKYTGERVTFNFQDIPVRSLLQLIADVSGANIVVADTVQGNVTLRLVNVPWDQALDITLQSKGLDKRNNGNVIWVAPTAEIAQREQALEDARIALEDRSPLISEYVPINYGKAKDISSLLQQGTSGGASSGGGASKSGGSSQKSSGFLSNRGSVTFDDRTNTLLINDTADKIAELKELIGLLDRPVDQVLIEARIVIADETFARDLGARFGVSGGYEDSNGNVISTGGSLEATDGINAITLRNRFDERGIGNFPASSPDDSGLAIGVPSLNRRLNVNLPAVSSAPRFALSILGADHLLDLELSALQTEGQGEVIASPRVITANQREALIKQGDEIGYAVTQITATGTTTTVNFKEVVLELKVIPTITQDDRVFMNLNVKKDEVSSFITTTSGSIPQISKRELNTAVLVENGQTVVLGGVYEFKSRKDLSKVPFLGDLPAVGNLFKNKSKSSSKAELLIFVTPKILKQRSA